MFQKGHKINVGRIGCWRGKSLPEQTRQKMSKAHKERSITMSVEQSIKEKKFQKGQIPWNKKGQRITDGYIYILARNHPNASKAGYVLHSRLIGENVLGRYLKKGEVVHHINFNRVDNRNSNLLICTKNYHDSLHAKIRGLGLTEYFASL